MTTMIPDLSEAQLNGLPSQVRDKLPKEYVVFFQVGWILRREEEQAKDGETDFLVCHPDHGYLCVEVKGGGVGFDATIGEWFSVDRHKKKHPINNPISQALRAKYSIRSKLNEHPRCRSLSLGSVLRGHTVFFPDVGDANALSRPDMPAVLIGSAKTLQEPKAWIDSAFSYWGNDARKFTPIGRRRIGGPRGIREIIRRCATCGIAPCRAGGAQTGAHAGPDACLAAPGWRDVVGFRHDMRRAANPTEHQSARPRPNATARLSRSTSDRSK